MNTQQIVTTSENADDYSLPAEYRAGNSSLAVSLARAEVDQQVATARALPRSIQRAVNNITTLATLDEETAAECIYAVPRGGKTIRGPSIRFAEILASQWGNCRVGSRVVHVDKIERYVEAEGVFHDLETNVAQTARVQRTIQAKRGKGIDNDMIQLAGAAACSIARRNAILAGIPKGIGRKGYQAAEQVLRGDIKTLTSRRELALKAFGVMGVTPDRVFAALGVQGVDDIDLDHLLTLNATRSAIKSGETTVEEAFPIIVPPGDRPKDLKGRLDKLAEPDKSDPPHDPSTGEILDNEPSSPSTAVTPAEQGQAAADARASVENGAGGPSSGGDPAPDPQGDPLADNAIGSEVREPSRGPQTGGEADQGASPPATSPTAADEARKARVVEIKRDGQARAEAGTTALSNYLEELRLGGEADFVTSMLRDQWRQVAKAVDAGRDKGRSRAQP